MRVLYAGSLVSVMERQIGPAFERRCRCSFRGEGRGSNAIANLILAGVRDPDVFVSADTAALRRLTGTPKAPGVISAYASFATSRMVLGYSPRSRFAPRFALVAAGRLRLPQLLQTRGLRIGRTDPRADPKGYRVLIAMQLAEHFFHAPGLAHVLGAVQNPAQIFPEEQLAVRLENGDLDAAFLYAVEARSRRLPAIEFPAAINLGDARRAGDYAKASVRIGGTVRRGAPIVYALAVLTGAPNPAGGREFVQFLLSRYGRHLLRVAGLEPMSNLSNGGFNENFGNARRPRDHQCRRQRRAWR
ncbi:MAG: hypothetical protein NVS1B14_00680 [Vulcanimicrobiaceae bacterium]